MKKAILLLITSMVFFSCNIFDLDVGLNFEPEFCSDTTSIHVKLIDYKTKEPLPDIKFIIYGEYLLSVWGGPHIIDKFSSDSDGNAHSYFHPVELTSYYLTILSDIDTTHVFPYHLDLKPGCENDFIIEIKPVKVLNLIVKNIGLKPAGESLFYISAIKNQPPEYYYQNFGYYTIDTIPIGFEKQFKFKVVPDQDLKLVIHTGGTSREVDFRSDSSLVAELVYEL